MRKKRLIITLLIATMLLAGCAQGTAHITVHKDGMVDVQMDVVLPSSAQVVVRDKMIHGIERDLDGQGIQFEEVPSEEGLHYRMKKRIDSSQLEQSNTKEIDLLSLQTEEHIFTTTYIVDGEVDVMEAYGGILQTINTYAPFDIMENMFKSLDFQAKLTLPYDIVKDHNASVKEGRTLTWDVSLTEPNSIYMELSVPNIRNIVIAAVGVLIVLITAVIWWLRRRKKALT
ncbi:YajG family lipoprotein [Pontibacillus litoralis]|uniref:DUF3153 domain-containing protein n=1 Tax=Pontibacillus litoralis JSM 072002 TaxID=1385512 RepID=A0A0A5G7L4_9BACI|nr:DUF3153 domain-containing protein [Pontibacillus litoralis]KGX87085.1 hypothetical protein N784_02725 [Pontibacillus litoralis JSM 072002]